MKNWIQKKKKVFVGPRDLSWKKVAVVRRWAAMRLLRKMNRDTTSRIASQKEIAKRECVKYFLRIIVLCGLNPKLRGV